MSGADQPWHLACNSQTGQAARVPSIARKARNSGDDSPRQSSGGRASERCQNHYRCESRHGLAGRDTS